MLRSADNTHCGPPVNATRSMFQTSACTTRLSMDMDTPVMKPNLTLLIVLLLFLQCAIAARAQTNGPLRVHPENPRYFTDDSGKAILFEGYGVQFQRDAWPNHPFNPANNINGTDGDADSDGKAIEIHQLASKTVTRVQEAYVRRIVETLNDFDNVAYEISNETHPGSTDWQYHMIRFVKRCEEDLSKQHPVGMTYQNRRGKNETLFSGPADWVSPNSEGGFRDDPPDMQGTKVVLSDTDHLWGIGGDAIWVWKSVTRGVNPIFMDTYDGRVLGKVRPEDDAPRRAMGLAIEYSRRLDLARAIPRNELSSTGYCLAEPGVAYLSLAPEGGEFEVDLTASSESFSVEWLDPATGEMARAPHVSGGAKRTFRGPFAGATVLFLQNTSPTKNKKLD